ncbi:MAG: PH domain-containing protein [Micrococcales bacterium]|nr:PH domain-containing protein [Micrococcales bacterium]
MDPTSAEPTPPSPEAPPHDSVHDARLDLPPPALRLRPPTHRVDPRARRWWVLRGLVTGGGATVVVAVPWWLWESARPWLAVPLALAAAWTLARVLVEPRWRYAVHRWETTDHAVYGLSGWITREWRVAPLSRVQTVDAVRGPLEQALGLATLRVTTASSSGALTIRGLDAELAAEVAERLTQVTERTPGDAT